MIIAKVQHKDSSITDLIFQPELQLDENDTLILNPLLDHYFRQIIYYLIICALQ